MNIKETFDRIFLPEPAQQAIRDGDELDGMRLSDILEEIRTNQGRRGYGKLEYKLAVVWGCVSLLTQRLQSLPIDVVDTRSGVKLETVPAWMRNKGTWKWDDLLSASSWSFLMRGNAFLRPRQARNGVISFVGAPHPDVVSAKLLDTSMLEGESDEPDLLVNGKHVSNLIHARWITEPGKWEGLSPIAAARRIAYISEAGQDAIALHFQQGVRKQGALTTEQNLGRRNKAETITQMRAKWAGVDNWWEPIVLDQGLKWTSFSMTAAEAEFLRLNIWTDAKICAQIFHIDPSLLGIAQPGGRLTYQNAQDREANLWKDALRPLATRIENLYSECLPTGQHLDFDESGLLTGAPRDRIAQAKTLADINMSQKHIVFDFNEIRERAGFARKEGTFEPLQVDSTDVLTDRLGQLLLGLSHNNMQLHEILEGEWHETPALQSSQS